MPTRTQAACEAGPLILYPLFDTPPCSPPSDTPPYFPPPDSPLDNLLICDEIAWNFDLLQHSLELIYT
jgi:hypothetical protein